MGNQISQTSNQTPTKKGTPFLPPGLAPSHNCPPLSEHQLDFLSNQQPFPLRFVLHQQPLSICNHFYRGQVSKDAQPHGHGLFFTPHGAVFAGKFEGLNCEGNLTYILPSGAYFAGQLASSPIESAVFEDPHSKTHYRGSLQRFPSLPVQFVPHGRGYETSPSYSFEGQFCEGRRKQGRLIWTSNNFQCTYEGSFDSKGRFQGVGVLFEQTGKYEGPFRQNLKHGKGRYQYKSKLVFEGQYFEGLKRGEGKLYNADGTVAYEGSFQRGLPHGPGEMMVSGQMQACQFRQGLPLEYQEHLDKGKQDGS